MDTKHYRNKYETVDIAADWKLSGPLFNVLKYIQRRGRKDNNSAQQDLLKAIWYLVYELTQNKEICDAVIETLGMTTKPLKISDICKCPECTAARIYNQKQL